MSLTYDTPAGALVYDSDPDREYDPDGRRLGHKALRARDGRIEFFDPHPPSEKPSGFGQVITRRMLDVSPSAKHPWLDVSLAEQELAIGSYKRDRAQIALDSIA